MDRAVRDLTDTYYKKVVKILFHGREDMDKVVERLLEKKVITGTEVVATLEDRDPALAGDFPNPDGRGTAELPVESVSVPILLSGGESQPPDGGGMELGPEGKPKEQAKRSSRESAGTPFCAWSWERRPLRAGGAT